jgi:hypothetical protein
MQLYGDLETLSFVRISRLHWIVEVNRLVKKKQVKYLIIIPREVD